jgi:cell division protein FtsL
VTRISDKTTLSGIAILIVLILEMFVYTWSQVQCRHLSYDLERAGSTYRQLQKTEQQLQTELASLRMPQRIEAEAARRLGLQRPAPEQIRRLP